MSKLKNLKKALLLSLTVMGILSSTACGPKGLPPTYRAIEPVLEENVLAFEGEYGVYVNYPVQVKVPTGSTPSKKVLGKCLRFEGTKIPAAIEIHPDVLNNSDELWSVLTHELMHCSLGLNHYEDEVDLMNSNVDAVFAGLKGGTQSRAGLIKRVNERTGLGKSFYTE